MEKITLIRRFLITVRDIKHFPHGMIMLFLFFTAFSLQVTAQTPTVADLVATGAPGAVFKWYDAASGGNLLLGTTELVDGQHYWASQTVNGCESTTRFEVTASVITQVAPTAATHTPSQTQIVWNWNPASGATGYKWNTTNDYSSATDMGTAVTKTESGLTCNTAYTRYLWAYNAMSCVSAVTTLSQSASSCGGDAIYNALSTSQANYSAAAANDLVKVTSAEYENVRTALSASTTGYLGPFTDWATSCAAPNTTFSYDANTNENTISTFTALTYPVAFSFHPSLNPAGAYSCQLKYNNGGTLTNISNYYSGATSATFDRQYFVIKTPSQLPNATPFVALFTTSGVATITSSFPDTYWSYVDGNLTGYQSFIPQTGAYTQRPSVQVLQSSSKQWP